MTHASYILTAWIVSAAAVAFYCARLLQRGRSLARRVAPERRRWMTTAPDAAVMPAAPEDAARDAMRRP